MKAMDLRNAGLSDDPKNWPPDEGAPSGVASPQDDRIEDETALMRAFASLRRAERALAQNRRMQAPALEELRQELAALEQDCARANLALEARAEHHRNRIEVYARTHRDELVQGKRKTRDFGIGKVSFRATGGEYRWRQDMAKAEREAALLEWAEVQMESWRRLGRVAPPLTTTTTAADVREIKRYVMADQSGKAEAPPGLEWVPEGESVSIDVKGGE